MAITTDTPVTTDTPDVRYRVTRGSVGPCDEGQEFVPFAGVNLDRLFRLGVIEKVTDKAVELPQSENAIIYPQPPAVIENVTDKAALPPQSDNAIVYPQSPAVIEKIK